MARSTTMLRENEPSLTMIASIIWSASTVIENVRRTRLGRAPIGFFGDAVLGARVRLVRLVSGEVENRFEDIAFHHSLNPDHLARIDDRNAANAVR